MRSDDSGDDQLRGRLTDRTEAVTPPIIGSVPGMSTLRSYRRGWLARDTIAGLVLAAFLVPVGMGYAEASGLPAITGLYATIVPLLVYALVGPSRILVLGPDSALAPIIAVTVLSAITGLYATIVPLSCMRSSGRRGSW